MNGLEPEVADVNPPTGEPSRAVGADASAPTSPALAAGDPVEYVGVKDFAGWRFWAMPMTAGDAHEDGYAPNAPGYLLRTTELAAAQIAAIKRAIEQNSRAKWFVKSMEERLDEPQTEWREERWLTEWLQRGLIKRADGKC